jgi:hypothetical protein
MPLISQKNGSRKKTHGFLSVRLNRTRQWKRDPHPHRPTLARHGWCYREASATRGFAQTVLTSGVGRTCRRRPQIMRRWGLFCLPTNFVHQPARIRHRFPLPLPLMGTSRSHTGNSRSACRQIEFALGCAHWAAVRTSAGGRTNQWAEEVDERMMWILLSLPSPILLSLPDLFFYRTTVVHQWLVQPNLPCGDWRTLRCGRQRYPLARAQANSLVSGDSLRRRR